MLRLSLTQLGSYFLLFSYSDYVSYRLNYVSRAFFLFVVNEMISLLFRQVNLFYSFCFERDFAFSETLMHLTFMEIYIMYYIYYNEVGYPYPKLYIQKPHFLFHERFYSLF